MKHPDSAIDFSLSTALRALGIPLLPSPALNLLLGLGILLGSGAPAKGQQLILGTGTVFGRLADGSGVGGAYFYFTNAESLCQNGAIICIGGPPSFPVYTVGISGTVNTPGGIQEPSLSCGQLTGTSFTFTDCGRFGNQLSFSYAGMLANGTYPITGTGTYGYPGSPQTSPIVSGSIAIDIAPICPNQAGTPPNCKSVPLTITTTSIPAASSGQFYSTTLLASGGSDLGYIWSVASGSLPSGFSLTSAGILRSTGTPATTATSYIFTAEVTDSVGNIATKPLTLIVSSKATGNPPLTISSDTLPDAVSGDAYNFQLMASGSQGSLTWALSAGSLPDGFSLSSNGQLQTTGTPQAVPGHYSFTVAAKDASSTASQALTLAVAPADCTKLFVVSPSNIEATVNGRLYVTGGPGSLIFETQDQVSFLNRFRLPLNSAIQIYVSGLKLNVTTPLPVGQVSVAFVQNLTEWSGYALYGTGASAREEQFAILANNATPPLLDVRSFDTSNPVPYFTSSFLDQPSSPVDRKTRTPVLRDSPNIIIAPIMDANNELLAHISYLKRFAAYIGCFNAYDRAFYPESNPLYFFHPLAVVNWHANYSGAIEFGKNSSGQYVFQNFEPDDPNDNGTHVDSMQVPLGQPAMSPPLANGSTTFQ